jgi:hypothetical protein
MKRYTLAGVILAAIIASINGYADTAIPTHIKEKMNGLVGSWVFEEETKGTPTSESVTTTGTWDTRWIFDNLIEWRATFSSSEGSGTTVEYEGYDPLIQGYSYWWVSNGERGQFTNGHWDGNTAYQLSIDIAPDGTRQRGRCTWPYNDDFTEIVNYQCERLEDGKWWVYRTGSAKKIKK